MRDAVLAVLNGMPGSGPLRAPNRQDPDAGPCNAAGCWALQRRYGPHGRTHCAEHWTMPSDRWSFDVPPERLLGFEPLLSAVECPGALLPANARAMRDRAVSLGWETRATYAIGWRIGGAAMVPLKIVRSVLVRATNRECFIWASWQGTMEAKTLSFDGGWRWPGSDGMPVRLSAADLKHEQEWRQPCPSATGTLSL